MDVVIDKNNSTEFVHLLLDLGEAMLCSGSEVNRVEKNFLKLGEAYGLKEINVFVIPSLITLTVRLSNDTEITQSRRISSESISTNLYRMGKLNNISHVCRFHPVPLDELHRMIEDSNKPVPSFRFCIGSALAAGSFSVFFGGSWWDGLMAAVIALIICFFQRKVASVLPNHIIVSFLCAIVIGTIGGLIGRWFSLFNADKILIGDIMLLIPGVAVTISARDIILGDVIAGSVRMIDSLFLTGGLALGFWLSFMIVGG